ncbi:MAG: hypothetical protein HY922_06385 [Elusimicrobia bacterium]|nr:hypothetical protein [Elusimicrobiota bacterium]
MAAVRFALLLWALIAQGASALGQGPGPGAAGKGGEAEAPRAVDLGIPATVPWQDAALSGGTERKAAEKAAVEEAFWERLAEDLDSVERSRSGLLAALRFARSHPEVFPPAPMERPEGLLDEFADLALRTWAFCADHYLALESIIGRYGDFESRQEDRAKRAAFSCACAARLAQRRFLAEWIALASIDPAIERLLVESSEPGFPAGLYGRLRQAASTGPEDAAVLGAYAEKAGAFGSLRGLLNDRLEQWEKNRGEDLSKPRARPNRKAASDMARIRAALQAEFPLLSRPGQWRGMALSEPEPQAEGSETAVSPSQRPPDWMDLPVSSQIVVAVQRVKSYLNPDPAQGPRPDSLITREQLDALKLSLEPGDVVLLRRELFVGEVGLGGYWREAALYAGAPTLRRKFFGRESVNAALYSLNADAFTENAAETRRGAPELLVCDKGRAALRSLESAGAGDALAVLRPRVSKPAKDEALRRVFALIGKPIAAPSGAEEAALAAGCAGELLRTAYPQGVRWPLRRTLGRAALSVNELVRLIDAEYATEKEQFDLISFLDAREKWQRAGISTIEDFRASWRRRAWQPKGAGPPREPDSEGERP